MIPLLSSLQTLKILRQGQFTMRFQDLRAVGRCISEHLNLLLQFTLLALTAMPVCDELCTIFN